MKKISIIIPVYNVDKYIDRIVYCLINQSYQNIEIIFIDDGSTDDSLEKLKKYQRKDKRIKVIHQTNKGVSVARNKGLKEVTGDYIAFVDSDDYLSLDMFKILKNNMDSTNADISVCNYVSFANNLPEFNISNNIVSYNKMEAFKDLLLDKQLTNFLWNKLFKKELFNDISFPKGKIYEDIYIMPKIFEKTDKICYTDSKLYGYYQRNNSCANNYSKIKNDNFLEFSNMYYEYLKKYKELELERQIYRCFYIYTAFLISAKSKCLEVFNSKEMADEYAYFKKNFKINKEFSIKRKVLYLVLYINKSLFYKIVLFLK